MNERSSPFWHGPCALLATVCLLAGCRDARDPNVYRVSGKVTFDGVPLDEADLAFEPVDERIGPAACTVKKGVFRMLASRGEHTVRINAYREIARPSDKPLPATPPGMPQPSTTDIVQYLPERYNRFTTLRVEVKKSGDTFTFDLDSKPDPKR